MKLVLWDGRIYLVNYGERKFILESSDLDSIKYYDDSISFKQGIFDAQTDFIINNIIPYKETRLAMVLGLASVVASYIEPYKSIGTLVLNVSGKSSTGKSTIAELSASFFASPETSNYGIVRTFNATKNFILGISEGRNGIPIILDDANANRNEHDKADLIYQFAMGEPRGRCNNTGNVQQKRAGWSGLVIITSESPILEGENVSQGANARCITLDSIPWTQSAEHSDIIKSGVRENYGFIGEEFANFLSNLNIDDVLELHTSHAQLIYSKMTKTDSLSKRIASKLAIISTTANLIQQFNPNFVIDENEIMDMIIQAEQDSIEERDLADKTLDLLIEFITRNRERFCHYERGFDPNTRFLAVNQYGDCYGMYCQDNNGQYYVYILSSVFDKFLKANNIQGRASILKEWRSKNIIVGDKDHNTVKVSSTRVKGRAIKMPIEEPKYKELETEVYEY